MKKLIAIFAFLFLTVSMAGAQSSVSGKVTSAADGSNIAGATITAVGHANLKVTSNSTGNFAIDIPAGVTSLICTFNGMKSQTKTISSSTMNFVLEKKTVINNNTPTKGSTTTPSN
ncbi:MAG: carboxypeptidase regulatory-like domain-containing protein [Bacteroidota bacterium]